MPAFKSIPIGKKFGRLTVSGPPIRMNGKAIKYPCNCACGRTTKSVGVQLTNKTATSCGCRRRQTLSKLKTTHGQSKTPLHVVWCGMNARCNNPNHTSYRYYGAKGIEVKDGFDDFKFFRRWALRYGYRDGLTLERLDGDNHYAPWNCVWANHTVQNRNNNHVHKVTFKGKTLCLSEWEEITGIKAATIRNRLKNNWTVRMALTKGQKQ